jgi:hypothetical protein
VIKYRCVFIVVLIAVTGLYTRTDAQVPINSNVALQPSKGGLIIRQQFRYTQGDRTTPGGDVDVRVASSITTLVYGVSDKATAILNTPFVLSRQIENNTTGSDDTDSGLADVRLLGKFRLYRDDFGPTDTSRFSMIAGLELPSGADAFSSDSIDPILGGVYTRVEGRHAFDADALWQFNTGGSGRGDDRLQYDIAYIYRLWPETYASSRPAALSASIELNGSYETNDDHEIFLSPGLQYVTTRWIAEATIQLPLWQDLNHRLERDFVIGLGVRVQF